MLEEIIRGLKINYDNKFKLRIYFVIVLLIKDLTQLADSSMFREFCLYGCKVSTICTLRLEVKCWNCVAVDTYQGTTRKGKKKIHRGLSW